MRVSAVYDLAFHLENKAQYAVGRRVLRPEVHREILDLSHRSPHP